MSTRNADIAKERQRQLIQRIEKLQKEIASAKGTVENGHADDRSSISPVVDDHGNLIHLNRPDDDEQNRSLKNENEKLKGELAEVEKYVHELTEKNRQLIAENRQASDAKAESVLLKKQLHAMREKMEKLAPDETSYRLRVEVLEERLHELQQQNFDLRRQIAGLTPDRNKSLVGKSDCEKCDAFLRQKALQAKYIIAQSVQTRHQLEQLGNECQKLKQANEELQAKNSDIETKYQKELNDVREYRDLYRRNSERSSKWYKTQMEAFTNEISGLKAKVADLEKYLVKVQWNSETESKQRQLMEELHKLTLEATSVANQVKRWRGVYD